MKYKLLVLDVDGTLLNDKKEITPRTHAALLKAQQMGVHVVLASGRPTNGVQPLPEGEGKRFRDLHISQGLYPNR